MNATPEHAHGGRIPYFDGWRGLSILLVLFGHFVWESPLGFASLGVELFFVLSGRLMGDILFAERFPLPAFFWRRISRIYPGLVVFVLVTWMATSRSDLAFKPFAVVAALTFTLNYAIVFHHGVAAIENLWSLCIEEHAYLLLGLLAFFARRLRFNPLLAIAGLGLASILDGAVSTLLLGQQPLKVYWRTDAEVSSILMAAAAFLALRRFSAPSWAPVGLFAATVAAAAAPTALKFVLFPILASLSMATVVDAPALVRTALSWRPLRTLGVWSYSIYLWQQPFSRLTMDGRMPAWAALAAALLCGLLSFHLVEQPARRWLNARWRTRRSVAAVGAPA